MPVSQDSSFINDYSEVKEQVIMVIEYLQQIKDSYFEQKHALEKQLNLLEIQLKENTGMIKMLEETNDSCYELFTPRNVNSKNKAKINELMEEQKSINESIENLKNSIKEYSSKIEQLDQIVEEENREISICITKISTFLILCDLAVCLATLYVSFSLVFALMRYLQGKVFLIRFYSPTTLSSSRAEFRLPSRLACA